MDLSSPLIFEGFEVVRLLVELRYGDFSLAAFALPSERAYSRYPQAP